MTIEVENPSSGMDTTDFDLDTAEVLLNKDDFTHAESRQSTSGGDEFAVKRIGTGMIPVLAGNEFILERPVERRREPAKFTQELRFWFDEAKFTSNSGSENSVPEETPESFKLPEIVSLLTSLKTATWLRLLPSETLHALQRVIDDYRKESSLAGEFFKAIDEILAERMEENWKEELLEPEFRDGLPSLDSE